MKRILKVIIIRIIIRVEREVFVDLLIINVFVEFSEDVEEYIDEYGC